MIIPRNRDFHG